MMKTAAALALGTLALVARADEGMWTFNGFPRQRLEAAFGVKVTSVARSMAMGSDRPPL